MPTFLRTQACPLRLEPGLCLPALLAEVEGVSPGCLRAGSCPLLPDLLGVAQARSWGPRSRWEAPTGGQKHNLAFPSSPGSVGHLSPRLPCPVLHRPPPSLRLRTLPHRGHTAGSSLARTWGQNPLAVHLMIFLHVVLQKSHPAEDLWEPSALPSFQKGKGPPLPCRSGGILSDVSLKCSDYLDISNIYCGCPRNPSHRFFRA